MPVVSSVPLILPLLLVICCIIGQGESHANRQRRQATGGDGSISQNNAQLNPNVRTDQQQLGINALPSSQGQPVRGRGFYDSPDYKPPSFSGDKPAGWFDTKYPNWVSNQDDQSGKDNMAEGKNAAPSSLQAKGFQPRREDDGAFFLQKVAKLYASKGEKAYNHDQFNNQNERGSVCINYQNYDGYTFGKFPCPLPAVTGMSQFNRYCCGPAKSQYCCNEQEFNRYQGGGFADDPHDSNHRHSKHSHYKPSSNRKLAIILPIAIILIGAVALFIIFAYYKKLRNQQSTATKTSGITRSNDNYSALAQKPPVDQSIINEDEQLAATVQA